MSLIKEVRGYAPQWGRNCYMAETATLIGEVIMGDDCSVWFNAVVRADVNRITIGNKVNIQDGAIIHCTYETAATAIGDSVSIGHLALVHGCTIEDNTLIGMGAIVMDHAVVQSGCLIAAGAVVTEHMICESGYIYAGTPARKIKALEDRHTENLMKRIADRYLMYADWYRV